MGDACCRRLALALLAGTLVAACAGPASWRSTSGVEAGSPTSEPERVADALRRELEAARRVEPADGVSLPAPRRGPAVGGSVAWVEVERPAVDATSVRNAWIEVAGFAAAHAHQSFDVVIAIDVSGSTRYASGADVNGNGVVGVKRRVPPWLAFEPSYDCSDPGDTVLDAERVAIRRLVERLDPRRTRVGIVSFSDVARPRAPLGSERALLDLVLDDLAGAFGAGATNLAEATRLATRMLLEGRPQASPAPDPVVLILSDGYPTHPDEARAADEALMAALEARDAGIRVTSLALGIAEPREVDVFAEMAHATGGEHLRVASPGDVVHALPGIDLARLAGVSVENLTTGKPARATRVRPDGSFDAYVRLQPGENRLRVTARGAGGGSASEERVVVYDDREPPDPEDVARLQQAIALRTLELELEREAREGRAAQRRVIRVEVDPDAAD